MCGDASQYSITNNQTVQNLGAKVYNDLELCLIICPFRSSFLFKWFQGSQVYLQSAKLGNWKMSVG
jgi:hypothetical protein